MRSFILTTIIVLTFIFTLSAQDFNQVDGADRKQGKWMKTYQNGAIRYEGQFRNDRPYGEFKYYRENTTIEAITNFSDDGVIARTHTFHENGQLMAKGKYINQKKDSTWLFYSDIDGKLIAEETYSNGKLDGMSTTFFAASGTLAKTVEYKNGLKQGEFKKYFPNGSVMIDGTYLNDQFHGDYIVYFPDGKIEIKGKYDKGSKIGDWEYYGEDGKQMTEEEFQNVYKTIEPQ